MPFDDESLLMTQAKTHAWLPGHKALAIITNTNHLAHVTGDTHPIDAWITLAQMGVRDTFVDRCIDHGPEHSGGCCEPGERCDEDIAAAVLSASEHHIEIHTDVRGGKFAMTD